MLAALNPCGFALLPAYVTFLLSGSPTRTRTAATWRALTFSASMTVGFAGAFALFGLALRPFAGPIQRNLPWFTVVLGIALVATGVWLLLGRRVALSPLPARGPAIDGTVLRTVGLGVAFAAASLGCTVGPFLAIVVSSFRAGSLAEGLALFLAYALGMGAVVALVAVAVALAGARASVVTSLRRTAPYISRAGGIVVLLAGAYVAYYGWYEIRVLNGNVSDDPVIGAAGQVQEWFADGLTRLGFGIVLALLAALVAAGLLRRRARRADA
jgi:cytochrome c biogenesis protein CcdA